MTVPVISAASAALAHVPGLCRHGSKPSRELPKNPEVQAQFLASLRTFEQAVAYGPHQAYLGAIHPRDLPERPWVGAAPNGAGRFAGVGELMPEDEFLGLLAAVDDFGLVRLGTPDAAAIIEKLQRHPLAEHLNFEKVAAAAGDAEAVAAEPGAMPLHLGADHLAAAVRRAHESDAALTADVFLENLAGKASATLALLRVLHDNGIDPASIDYVIGSGEEAIGDRYQRGGGNLGKSVAAAAGCLNASGCDVKNFCAAPIPALVIASSLVAAGVFQRVAVVAGGSLPKVGMKFQGHLKNGLPVLEDVLGASALIVEADDGRSPRVRLDSVGRHTVAAGSSNPKIMEALVFEPLDRLGMSSTDVDDYATELHNPEITEPQGSGNVPERNYKTIAALALRRGDIGREDMGDFVEQRGMPGFAPTQGHIASALCYVPHARARLMNGDAQRVQLIAKGSLFLGRMSEQSDGMSVLLESNDQSEG
ncbi:MAG TPA: glycine/sarcosine/betaine reductase complex component C subunit beta [Solirubrobacteraceae bacterium]|jgi:betaine reductase|nr:glycine/sarcosine/betaine reductase complex component C subunit beta [Solirubrobacteraceae bacterium]